jgi:predicted nucleotidyltransferase
MEMDFMDSMSSVHLILANKIAEQFKSITCVEAIALGGSQTKGPVDRHSDIDLYVYSNEIIPLSTRQAIVEKLGASRADLNLTFWDLGDEWFDLETGIEVDIMYWDQSWIAGQLERVLDSYHAGMGYSTCFWHTVSNSVILFDRQGWFAKLQEKCIQPYPEQLKRAILAKNHPVLRSVIPSYYVQIKKAIERKDLISINHRLAALFASYFDVLFALNEVLNPGEKKVLRFVLEQCSKVPMDLQRQVKRILQSAAIGDVGLLHQLDELLDGLDDLLAKEGFDPARTLLLDKK